MEAAPKGTLRHRWDVLNNLRGDLLTRCETYAAWTLPYIFKPEYSSGSSQYENHLSNDSIGARGVNHLANRLVSTLFRPNGPFFRLSVGMEQRELINSMSQDSKGADAAALMKQIDDQLAIEERKGMEMLDMIEFRPTATLTAKYLIITGNALEFHPEGGKSQTYSLRDYCVQRDIEGNVIEIMTRDCKAFETFHPAVQDELRLTRQYNQKQYDDKTPVTIYTNIRLEHDGKYHVKQAADLVNLDIGYAAYPKDKLPWIALTWNLSRGDDYGTGLIEDFAGAFHSIEQYTQSLLRIGAVMSDIKFLVNPGSLVDLVNINNSPAGSYHSGKEGDITAIETNKQGDARFLMEMIERYSKQLGQAFMLNNAVTRDAERVTAEEIRMQAAELETSHGGMYSRQAFQWQTPLAKLLLDYTGFDGEDWGITPSIITGMDTLSRQGEMDQWFQWVQGMASIEGVPEDMRRVIDPLKWAAMWGKNLQVDWASVCYTDEELQAQAEREQQMLAQQEQNKAAAGVAQEAGKQAVQGE